MFWSHRLMNYIYLCYIIFRFNDLSLTKYIIPYINIYSQLHSQPLINPLRPTSLQLLQNITLLTTTPPPLYTHPYIHVIYVKVYGWYIPPYTYHYYAYLTIQYAPQGSLHLYTPHLYPTYTHTERYKMLPQAADRLVFLNLQKHLIDEFRIRLIQKLKEPCTLV